MTDIQLISGIVRSFFCYSFNIIEIHIYGFKKTILRADNKSNCTARQLNMSEENKRTIKKIEEKKMKTTTKWAFCQNSLKCSVNNRLNRLK